MKSGVLAISHARAIAGNEELLRLSEIWQKTSITRLAEREGRVAHLARAVDREAHQLEPLTLERLLEPLPGQDGVDLPGREQGADPAGLRQDFADRPGHRGIGKGEVGPGHVRPVVRVRLSRPRGDRIEHDREDDRLPVHLPERGLQCRRGDADDQVGLVAVELVEQGVERGDIALGVAVGRRIVLAPRRGRPP